MRLDQINSAARLATKLASLKERREAWTKVNMNDAFTARRFNANGSLTVGQIPMIDDDSAMHRAIVQAIIAEYTRRIEDAASELGRMGVEGTNT